MSNKKSKKKLSFGAVLVIVLITLFDLYIAPNFTSETPPDPATSSINDIISDGTLNIHYIDVGQADATLITLNDSAMLIDAGNYGDAEDGGDGDLVVNYINNLGISSLDYVIGTHPHDDHIGGLSKVVDNFDIETILMPKVAHTNLAYKALISSIKEKSYSVTTPHVGDTYKLSDAEFTILSCKNENTEELNTTSIVIRLVFGQQSYIFCADAEKENEYDMMDSGLALKSNVIKVGHHGSTTSSLEKFLLAVEPEIAVISVGADNSYGHPHEKIVKRLDRLGIKTYRTDKHGTIVISSDGKTNKVTVTKEG